MEESISKFITEGKALLWIKTNDFQEVERAMIESLNSLENKKFYIYEKGKTVNFLNNSIESGMGDLFNTLDDDSYDTFRILKGGSWGGYAADCDLLCSKFNLAVRANREFGFRIVRTI